MQKNCQRLIAPRNGITSCFEGKPASNKNSVNLVPLPHMTRLLEELCHSLKFSVQVLKSEVWHGTNVTSPHS